MASAGNEYVIRHFEENGFASGPADWAADGVPFLCLEPNFEGVGQGALENGNYRTRAFNPHPMVPGLRNGELSFGLYWHGGGATAVTAPGSNAASFIVTDLLRNAWGGRRLGRASTVASATETEVTLAPDEGAQYVPGDWMFLVDAADNNRGRFVRVGAVDEDVVTPLFSAPVAVPDNAVSGAVVVNFLHTRALINRAHPEHATHSFLQVREADDDVVEARGVKLTLSGIDAIESGGEPVLRFEGMATTHRNEGLERPDDPALGDIVGDVPLVVSQGSDTFVMLGDLGDDLEPVVAHAVSLTPAVTSAPVPGVGGIEGRHGFRGSGFEGTRVELVVEHDEVYFAEWEARTRRHFLLQIGTTQGRAVGLYMPNMLLTVDPRRTTSEDLATVTLTYEAYEFEGDQLDGLTEGARENYRSKIQLLHST